MYYVQRMVVDVGEYFCGYEGTTQLKEIRTDFRVKGDKYRAICEYINSARKQGYKQFCDTLFYIILNDIDEYWKVAKKSDDNGTYTSNIVRGVYGEKNKQRIRHEDLMEGKDETYTLDRLRDFFEAGGYVTSHFRECEGDRVGCKDKNKILEILIPGKISGGSYLETMPKIESANINNIIEDALQSNKPVIFTGAPGTGKTYSVRKKVNELVNGDMERMEFVQFHPSYDYSDFVEGLRPIQKDGESPTFVRMDGTFKAFCRRIVEDHQAKGKYYFIIDEINRADISRVFGELMFGLEESYRGKDKAFKTQYQNLPTYCYNKEIKQYEKIENDCFENGFYIPENLYVIGTMNDIDRSVESFDFAMRRRFRWIDVKANDIMQSSLESIILGEKNISADQIDLMKEKILKLSFRIMDMNDAMINYGGKYGLNEAYHIGPAYFKDYDGTEEKVKEIFEQGIEPIIREYMRGRDKRTVDQLVEICKNTLLDYNSEAK